MNQKQTTFLVNLQTFVPFGSLMQVLPFRFSLMYCGKPGHKAIECNAQPNTCPGTSLCQLELIQEDNGSDLSLKEDSSINSIKLKHKLIKKKPIQLDKPHTFEDKCNDDLAYHN